MVIVRAGDLKGDELQRLLSKVQASGGEEPPAWFWLTTPDEWTIERWRGLEARVPVYQTQRSGGERAVGELVSKSEWGCIFQPLWELRWRRLEPFVDGRFRVRFAGEPGDDLQATLEELLRCALDVEGWQAEQRKYRLWGEHSEATDPDWIELRIPHRFRYPVPTARYVWLEATLMRDRQGVLQLVRWQRLFSGARED